MGTGGTARSTVRRGVFALVLLALAVSLATACAWPGMGDHMSSMHGGGTDSTDQPEITGVPDQLIEIRDFAYDPGNVVVPLGARVRWVNYDEAPHSAIEDGGTWDTRILQRGEEETLTFTTPGEYEYYCSVHPSMRARLVVR